MSNKFKNLLELYIKALLLYDVDPNEFNKKQIGEKHFELMQYIGEIERSNYRDAGLVGAQGIRIKELEQELARLREALADIAHGPVGYWNDPERAPEVVKHLVDKATKALQEV